MAEIAPFRGILYDTAHVRGDDVLAPPYDVIDAAMRRALSQKSDRNCVGLILPEGEGDDKYTAAAHTMAAWLKDGTLRRDPVPAFYRYHQQFSVAELGAAVVTRRGFIAQVKLHDFADGVILRHEKTLSGPKADRLKLMTATEAHLSQIFALYADPAGVIDDALAAVDCEVPVLDATTDDGTRHLLWRVTDPAAIARVTGEMAQKSLYIADGHHRYETMLALRDRFGGPAAFGTMFLANMDDPGLVVLPTHRLVFGLASFSADALLADMAAWFSCEPLERTDDATFVLAELAKAGAVRPSLAAIFPDGRGVLCSLRADFDAAAAGLDVHPAVARLDVTLLHSLILERSLGITPKAQEAQAHLSYFKDTGDALARIAAGKGQVCFVMNATPVDQVTAVADAGQVMPQKSTFFYPKIASGIVFRSLAS